MMDEHDGIDRLRRAIDDLAGRMPAGAARRRVPAVALVSATAGVIAVVALLAGWPGSRRWIPFAPRTEAGRATAAAPGVEVKVLRLKGRDVEARVFDAAGAGAIVVAPVPDRREWPVPVGVVGIPRKGAR
jgi:hypothetical protein